MAISVDAVSSSGEKTSVSSVTHSHTTGSGSDRVIVVTVSTRGGSDAALTISGITYNSVALSKARSDQYNDVDAGQLQTEIWYLVNPSSGANNVVVTFGGTVTRTVVGVITFTGVHQTIPLDASNGNNAVGKASPISNAVTTVADNSYVVDVVYSKTGGDITKGGSQTLIHMTATNSSGDRAGSSYLGPKTPAGSASMSWTYATADDYCQTIASFKPATTGTNMKLNIGDTFKTVSGMQINVGDSWKSVTHASINIGDTWKSIF